jgi:putative transposase
MESEPPKRAHPVHGVLHVPDKPTIVFGTVCTKHRMPWLANARIHEHLANIWGESRAWAMGRYVIMPDHIHFFAAATDSTIPFDNWVRYWKSLFRKNHPLPDDKWQSHHWDTRLRSHILFEEKWNYVRQNPVRQGLVKKADDWPFQGEVFELRWD